VTEFTLIFSSTLSYPISWIILHTFILFMFYYWQIFKLAKKLNQEIKKNMQKRH